MPSIDENTVAVTAAFRSGTQLDAMNRSITEIEKKIQEDSAVKSCNITISGDKAVLTAYLDKEGEFSTGEVIARWNEELVGVTGMDISIESTGTNMTSMMSGGVEIDLSSRNLQNLKEASKQVEEVMRKTPGIVRTSSDASVVSTKAEIIIDPLKAMNVGLTPVQVAMNLGNVLSGMEATTIKNEGEEYRVMLEYPAGKYDDMNSLLNVSMETPYKTLVPLRDIAAVSYTDAPETLTRVDGVYQIAIKASTTETAKFTAANAVNAAVEDVDYRNICQKQNRIRGHLRRV